MRLSVFRYDLAVDWDRAVGDDEIGIVYCIDGWATLEDAGGARPLAANQAAFYRGPALALRTRNARLVRWSLAGPCGNERPLLDAPLPQPARPFVLRCDRVDFPLGGVAYRHTHRGPGIRLLLAGELAVTTSGRTVVVTPDGAWFEAGPEPVFAQASQHAATSFVRVMVLPADVLGQSSIRYADPADREKPKSQRYTIFIDELVG